MTRTDPALTRGHRKTAPFMGENRETRPDTRVPVRIFGTDAQGRVFSEKVVTTNISQHGVEVSGVQAQLKVDEIIGLAYGANKGHFRVRWVGQSNTPNAGHVGLLNLVPDKVIWDASLSSKIEKANWPNAPDRRTDPRIKCKCSIELHPHKQAAPIRSRTGDLSRGGCFVEMSIPLPKDTRADVAIWLNETKIWAKAKVVTCTPGFGIGMHFLEMSSTDKLRLHDFLQELSRTGI